MRVIAFDIDGTLLLSGGAGARALDRAFLELHGEPDAFRGIHPHGMTDGDIIQEMGRRTLGRGMTAGEVADLRERYAFLLRDELPRSEGFRLMPGVETLLRRLSREGDVLLGLVTGNYEETAMMKLAHGGLDGYFRFGGYGSDSDARTELTRLGFERGRKMAGLAESDGSVFLVGDTVHDIRCGKEAGARVIAVATGSTPAETLRDHGPEWVLPDLTDTEAFLGIVGS
jgi:phosphoglycolate phosphatase